MYLYKVSILRVVDGDTVDVDIDLGFSTILKKKRVRLYGIDTPESRTRDLEEKKYGKAAKAFLVECLEGKEVMMKVHDKGKFGRIIGELFVEKIDNEGHPAFEVAVEQSVNQMLIDNHHAVPYFGQSKEEIKEQHLINRTKINL